MDKLVLLMAAAALITTCSVGGQCMQILEARLMPLTGQSDHYSVALTLKNLTDCQVPWLSILPGSGAMAQDITFTRMLKPGASATVLVHLKGVTKGDTESFTVVALCYDDRDYCKLCRQLVTVRILGIGPKPALHAVAVQDGRFGFKAMTRPGLVYRLESSPDMVRWTAVAFSRTPTGPLDEMILSGDDPTALDGEAVWVDMAEQSDQYFRVSESPFGNADR